MNAPLVPNFASIPPSMRAYAAWVVWRLETKPGEEGTPSPERTKVPYIAGGRGRKASHANAETWRAFDVARRAYEAGGYDGIGFVLSADDPFVFIDLDHCRDPRTGILSDQARALLAQFGTYAELSPSGTGLHLFVCGAISDHGRKRGGTEIYADLRYATVTGHRLHDAPIDPVTVNGPLDRLYASLAPPAVAPLIREIQGPGGLDDAAVIERAGASRQGAKFRDLMAGDTFGYGGDDSAADLAFCGMLAFWCANDLAQMDRLFRASGLMRPKWDSRRGQQTYGAITLRRAQCPNPYDPRTGAESTPPDPRNTRAREDGSVTREIPGSGASDDDPLIREIQGPGDSDPDPRNTRARGPDLSAQILQLRAELAAVAADRDRLARELAATHARLDVYETSPLATIVEEQTIRAERAEAALRALMAVLEHQDLTFRQRVVTADAMHMAGAYRVRGRFGEEPAPPEPAHVPMAELEARVGIPKGTAAQSLKPAAGLGIITRNEHARTVKLADGTVIRRTEIAIGPGSGAVAKDWRDHRRVKERERAEGIRVERRKQEELLAARTPELERADERAVAGCSCGGRLAATGYFCTNCHTILSPAAVLAWPDVEADPPDAGDAGRTTARVIEVRDDQRAPPLIPEIPGVFINTKSPVKYQGQGNRDPYWEGRDDSAF